MNTIRQHLTSFYKHRKVLVTGGAGFIGSHITHELVSLGATVTVLDDLSTGNTTHIASIVHQISFIEGSITNPLDCTTALKNIDVVFHLAAKTSVPESLELPADYYHTNVTGTLNLLEATRNQKTIKGFVFSSSSAVYGPTLGSCSEDRNCNPTSVYGYTKYVGELLCQNYKKNYGIPTVSLRYFNVYGPRQNDLGLYSAVIPRFIYQLKRNLPLTIYGDGSQSRDFVPVSDVVQANLLIGMYTSGLSEPCFNIASNKQMTLLELIHKLRHDYPKSRSEILFEPARPGDILHSQADTNKYQLFLKKRCLHENL